MSNLLTTIYENRGTILVSIPIVCMMLARILTASGSPKAVWLANIVAAIGVDVSKLGVMLQVAPWKMGPPTPIPTLASSTDVRCEHMTVLRCSLPTGHEGEHRFASFTDEVTATEPPNERKA